MRRSHDYSVYSLASKPGAAPYTDVTNDPTRRVSKYQQGTGNGHALRYRVGRRVWFEHLADIDAAILREKRIKRRRRDWKFALFETDNPTRRDLTQGWSEASDA